MTVSAISTILLRRWWATLVVLLVAATASLVTYTSSAEVNTADFAISVAPSPSFATQLGAASGQSRGVNPYLEVGGASTLAALTTQELAGQAVDDKAISAGPGLSVESLESSADDYNFTVTYDDITRPSYLTGTVTAPEADGVSAGIAELTDYAAFYVRQLQLRAGASDESLYAAVLGTQTPRIQADYPTRLRDTLAVAMSILVVGGGAIVLIDGLLARRRTARAASHGIAGQPTSAS